MSYKKRNLIIVIVCTFLLACSLVIWFYISQKDAAYRNIHLEFKKPQESYEIDEKLDPISFIKSTNVDDIDYPDINPTTIGEHTYIYVCKDGWGNQKEFVLLLMFEDPIKPVLTLSTNTVEITEGDDINLESYVSAAYDEQDGELKVKIKKPKDYLKVGTHEIEYSVHDKHNNVVRAILSLIVKEKPVVIEEPNIPTTDNNNSSTNNGSSNNSFSSNSNSNANTSSSNNSSNNSSSGGSSNTNSNTNTNKPASNPSQYNRNFEGNSIASYNEAYAYAESIINSGKVNSYSVNPNGNGFAVTFN